MPTSVSLLGCLEFDLFSALDGGRQIGKLRLRTLDEVTSVSWGTPSNPESKDVVEIGLKNGRTYYVRYIHDSPVDAAATAGPRGNDLFIALFCTVCAVE